MNDLWSVIAKICIELHPDKVASVANSIREMGLEDAKNLRNKHPNIYVKHLLPLISSWEKNPTVSSPELSSALLAASKTIQLKSKSEKIELVWSGPSTVDNSTRLTEQVICEIIDDSREELFIVSFVAYKIERISNALKAAAKRKVKISFLLEQSVGEGGSVSFSSLAVIKRILPRANFYIWQQNDDAVCGAVHAKCIVADNKAALISSANLTGAAMDRNIESGVYIKGGNLPRQIASQLESLVNQNHITKIG